MLVIKSIKWKNFLSYGEQFQGYQFAKGLTTISAPSGYGKSVLLEALSYSLYGQPYRDIKMDDLINRTNGSNMMTECEFEANGQNYKVIRGRKPDAFVIEKNGKAMDKASSISLTQDSLTKIIGIDFDMFKRVLCISTVNNSPFLDSSKESKRKAKDQLFNLEALGVMLKKAKEEATLINTSVSVTDNSLEITENELEKAAKALKEHNDRIKSFDEEKEQAVKALGKRIKEAETAIIANNEEHGEKEARRAKIENKIAELEIEKVQKKETELKAQRIALKKGIEKSKSFIEKGKGACEACGQNIGEECISDAKAALSKREAELANIEKELKEIQDINEKREEGLGLMEECESKMKELSSSTKALKSSINDLKEQIEKEKNREYPDADSAKKRMAEAEASLKQSREKSKEAKDKKALNKEVQKVLGDDGVKKVIIAAILPMFNELIAVNCQRFGLPMLVEFDEKMDEIIKECGLKYPYKGCSEGEKARLNLAIQMAMLEISRAISGWDCNLIVLDEILDNSLDVASIIKIANHLKERCANGSNIIVISHKLASGNSDLFDKTYKIEKHLNFSLIR